MRISHQASVRNMWHAVARVVAELAESMGNGRWESFIAFRVTGIVISS